MAEMKPMLGIDWWAEITGPAPEAPQTNPPAAAAPAKAQPETVAQTDWWIEVTQGPNRQEVRSTTRRSAPVDVIQREDLQASNMAIARASLAVSVQDQIKRYAEHFNAPVENFGVMNGEIVRWVPEENIFARVVPRVGITTSVPEALGAIASQWASGAGPFLPAAASTVAGAFAPPTPASIPLSAIAAGMPGWVRRALADV